MARSKKPDSSKDTKKDRPCSSRVDDISVMGFGASSAADLAMAAQAGDLKLGALLIEAAHFGDVEVAERILSIDGTAVNAIDPSTGLMPLHIAVGRDHLALARYLVENCAEILAVDRQGRTPSSVAAECEVSEEMCDFVVEAEERAETV